MYTFTVRMSRMAVPPLCVACGELAGGGTLPVSAGDWSGKRSITMQFPLCQACAEVTDMSRGALGGLSRRKIAKNHPELSERFKRIQGAVKLRGYNPNAFRSARSDSITVQLAEPRFARIFAIANGLDPGAIADVSTGAPAIEPIGPEPPIERELEPAAPAIPPRPDR